MSFLVVRLKQIRVEIVSVWLLILMVAVEESEVLDASGAEDVHLSFHFRSGGWREAYRHLTGLEAQ
jgi:hypothetical protein